MSIPSTILARAVPLRLDELRRRNTIKSFRIRAHRPSASRLVVKGA
jgi:hypothetical protein